MRWQPWAPEHITEAFIRKTPPAGGKAGDAMTSEKDIVGAVARQGIRAGMPIMKGQVVKPKDRGFLSAVLDAGKRAIAAPITNVTGIAGFVFPGDRIDLILTHSIRSSEDEAVQQRRASVTVVHDVRVLALDQDSNDQGEGKPKVAKVVTLEVTPKQAEILTLALQLGTISLSLRSLADDPQMAVEDKTDKMPAQLIGYEKADGYTLDSDVSNIIPKPAHRAEISGQIIQVLRGSKARTEEDFTEKKPQ
jgi:pilus assembly protein CpaB